VGNRLAMVEIGTGINKQTVWQYDNLNRLIQEQATDNSTSPAMIHTTTYSMDAVGNRTNQSKDGISTDYAYDNNDRLMSESTGGMNTATFSYDNQGNTISVQKNGITTNYGYNAENQLVQSGVNQFAYDVDGIRSSKTSNGITTNYITDKNRDYAQVVLESNGATSTSYSYGDQLISATNIMGSSYVLKDAQGSTKALTNTSGATTDTYSYNAYGETTSKTGTTSNNYLYAGEQFDPDLNQYYNRARYYNQTIGRFSQQDSYQGNNQEPMSLHKYLYASGNPVMFTDPSGNFSLAEDSTALAVAGILAASASYEMSQNIRTIDLLNDDLPRIPIQPIDIGIISMAIATNIDVTIQRTKVKVRSREPYVATEVISFNPWVYGKELTLGEAVAEVKLTSDVLGKNQSISRNIAYIAGDFRPPVGPEIHGVGSGFRRHYHTWDRSGLQPPQHYSGAKRKYNFEFGSAHVFF